MVFASLLFLSNPAIPMDIDSGERSSLLTEEQQKLVEDKIVSLKEFINNRLNNPESLKYSAGTNNHMHLAEQEIIKERVKVVVACKQQLVCNQMLVIALDLIAHHSERLMEDDPKVKNDVAYLMGLLKDDNRKRSRSSSTSTSEQPAKKRRSK